MVKVTSNAGDISARYSGIAARLSAAMQRGLLTAMSEVEKAAQFNLSGGGAPFSYPVPVRTGNLRGQLNDEQLSPTVAEIFDTAAYAWAVSSGLFNEWAGRGKTRRVQRVERPFLYDALDSTDVTGIVRDELQTVFA